MSRAPLVKRRPVCVHCGLRYGRRATHSYTLRWEDGEPEPRYPGSLVVVRWRAVRKSAPAISTPMRGGVTIEVKAQPNARDIEVWDGQTWSAPYEPFCTLRCALGYARKAYARGQGGAR